MNKEGLRIYNDKSVDSIVSIWNGLCNFIQTHKYYGTIKCMKGEEEKIDIIADVIAIFRAFIIH